MRAYAMRRGFPYSPIAAALAGIVQAQHAPPGFIIVFRGRHQSPVGRKYAMAEKVTAWCRIQCQGWTLAFRIKGDGKEARLPAEGHDAPARGIDREAMSASRQGNDTLIASLCIDQRRFMAAGILARRQIQRKARVAGSCAGGTQRPC